MDLKCIKMNCIENFFFFFGNVNSAKLTEKKKYRQKPFIDLFPPF